MHTEKIRPKVALNVAKLPKFQFSYIKLTPLEKDDSIRFWTRNKNTTTYVHVQHDFCSF